MWLEDSLGGISLGNLSGHSTKQFYSRWKYSTANKPSHSIPPPSPLGAGTCDPLERAVSGMVEWDSAPLDCRSSQTATHEAALPSLLSPTTFCKVAVMRREKRFVPITSNIDKCFQRKLLIFLGVKCSWKILLWGMSTIWLSVKHDLSYNPCYMQSSLSVHLRHLLCVCFLGDSIHWWFHLVLITGF